MGCGISTNKVAHISNNKKEVPFNSNSKIAIIGAGAGGIHMAYQLKKRGYRNITIFEKDGQIGGKAKKFTSDKGTYDMQTIFMYCNENVNQLLNDAGVDNHFVKNDVDQSKVCDKDIKYLPKFDYFAKTNKQSKISFGLELKKYIEKYKELYKKVTDQFGFPKIEYIKDLSLTMGEFLDINNLGYLKPVFHARLDVTGYGGINIPAFYGIMGVTPDSILNIKVTYNTTWNDMWNSQLKKSGAKIILNSNISSITYEDDRIAININDTVNYYDFAILAAPHINKIIKNKTYYQEKCQSNIDQMNSAIASLCQYKYIDDTIPKLKYETLYIPERHHETNIAVIYKKFQDKNLEVYGQYLSNVTDEKLEVAKKTLEQDQIKHNKKAENIHTDVTTTYFPHFNQNAIRNGYPWQMFNIQGENKMWFIGASYSFDLTYSIVNYNHKLLDQYDFGNMGDTRNVIE